MCCSLLPLCASICWPDRLDWGAQCQRKSPETQLGHTHTHTHGLSNVITVCVCVWLWNSLFFPPFASARMCVSASVSHSCIRPGGQAFLLMSCSLTSLYGQSQSPFPPRLFRAFKVQPLWNKLWENLRARQEGRRPHSYFCLLCSETVSDLCLLAS